jgi:hypothetical protein
MSLLVGECRAQGAAVKVSSLAKLLTSPNAGILQSLADDKTDLSARRDWLPGGPGTSDGFSITGLYEVGANARDQRHRPAKKKTAAFSGPRSERLKPGFFLGLAMTQEIAGVMIGYMVQVK